MPKEATGHVETRADGTKSVRIRTGDAPNDRPWFGLPRKGGADRARLLADLALRLRKVVGAKDVELLLRFVADARTERGLAEAAGAAEDIADGTVKSAASAVVPTFHLARLYSFNGRKVSLPIRELSWFR